MHGPLAFGPMICPCSMRPPWADETVDNERDKEHAGKENAENAGKEVHDPHKQQEGARDEKS